MKKIYNVTCELLEGHLVAQADKVAIYYEQEKITYRQLVEQINRFGNALKELQVAPGERILLALPDSPECVIAFLGAIKYGAWPILTSPWLSVSTYEFILDDSQASFFLAPADTVALQARSRHLRQAMSPGEANFVTLLNQTSPELDPYPSQSDDIAFMLYSSGSTGNPKGVPHRHRDLPFTADTYGREVLHIDSSDLCFSASKLFFAYGLGNSLSFPFRVGAAVVLFPGKSTPQEVLRIISEYKPTIFFGVPTLYNMLLKTLPEGVSFDSLRLCLSAGEALPAGTYHAWKKLTGLEIIDGIGSTEALHIFISNRPGEVCPGTSGFLVPPYEAKIVDNSGQPVLRGEPGQLLIRGDSTSPFYWHRPEKTQETMLDDGWLNTGDIFLEQSGCFIYQGRADDMFKVDAQWVSPIRVEQALRDHPAVAECAVTWRKLEGLVKPVAYVILNPGWVGDMKLFRELRTHVLKNLPDYMCPVQFIYCTELPATETGKIQRFRLRQPQES